MVEWLAGNRIRGTSAEKPVFGLPSGSAGGWKLLGRNKIGSATSDFNVPSLDNKRYYMILTNIQGKNSSGVNWQTRMGNGSINTSSIYGMRYSLNGATDSATDNQDYIQSGTNPTDQPQFSVGYIANISGQSKLYMSRDVNQQTAGAGNAPKRGEYTGKWKSNDVVDVIGATTTSSYTMSADSEMVVLGWDPTDTHTDNFWEELASVEYNASTPNELDTGTITAKKYLWVQAYVNTTGTQDNQAFRFNGNTGNNYCWEDSQDGAADVGSSPTAYNYLRTCVGDDNNNFVNAFILNNSGQDKLIMSSAVKQSTAGTGVAPESNETVGKFTVQSGQITSIKLWQSGGGSFASGAIMKVWGHD